MSSKMSKSSFCYLCGKPIKFDNEYISERTGKKIPLDAETNEPHNCPVWRSQQQEHQQQSQQQQQQQQQTQRKYYSCRRGCGQLIYFDTNNENGLTESGKWIPLSKETGLPHQCQ
jgi:hypothetical protein